MSKSEWILTREPGDRRLGSMAILVRWLISPASAHAVAARTAALVAAFLINCAITTRGSAQIAALQDPQFTLMDVNDVDLLSANAYLHETDVSIGSKEHPLGHTMYSGPDGVWTLQYPQVATGQALFGWTSTDAFRPGDIQWPNGESPSACPPASAGLPAITVQLGNSSEVFQAGIGCQTFTATEPTGDTLVLNSWPNGTFTYTKADGTQAIFSGYSTAQFPPDYTVQQITYPDGRVLTYWYANTGVGDYLKSITRSDGLQLKYTYSQMSNGGWALTAVTAINNAYEYCTPTADACTLHMAWPKATYSYSGGTPTSGGLTMTVTDAAGWQTTYTTDAYGRTTGISSASINVTYGYCDSSCTAENVLPTLARANNFVRVVTRNSQTWLYAGNPGPISRGTCTKASYGFTNPVGSGRTVLQDLCEDPSGIGIDDQWPAGTDPFNQLTDEQGNVFGGPGAEIGAETMPEGNVNKYSWYGPRLASETRVPKPGSPLTSITSSANYGWSGCNSLTCYEPHWVKDFNGNETDYTYDSRHGGVLTEMQPPDASGIRPQTNYTYIQQSAYALNSVGQRVASPPIWVLSTESYCRTSNAATDTTTGQVDCGAGTGDKVLKTYYYGPSTNTGPNNLFLRGVQVQATGSKGTMETHVTCYGYDALGHRISVTTPNAGLGLSSCDQFTQSQ